MSLSAQYFLTQIGNKSKLIEAYFSKKNIQIKKFSLKKFTKFPQFEFFEYEENYNKRSLIIKTNGRLKIHEF